MLKKLKVILFSFTIFLYIYGPDIYFLPINIVDIIAVISLFYLISYMSIFLNFLLYYKAFFVLLFLIIFYLLSIEAFHGYSITTNSFSILNLRIFLEGILPSFAIVVYGFRNNYSFESFYKIFIIIALFQFVITLFMLDINFKVYMFETFMKYDLDSPLLHPQHFSMRGFGLAKNHLFAFPVAQGLIVVIGFYYSLKKKSILVFLGTIFIIFTIIVNARSGLLPILIFIFVLFLSSLFSFNLFYKNVRRFILSSILVILMIPFILTGDKFENTIRNIEIAYESTVKLILYGEKQSTYDDIYNEEFWKLPDTSIDWIFGGSIKELHSDVGYIRNLHYGGLIYIILLYSTMGYLLISTFRNIGFASDKSVYKFILSFSIFASFFILEIKGHIFTINEAMRLIVLILIIGYFDRKVLKIYEKE